MSQQTIGYYIQEYRAFAALYQWKLTTVGVNHSQRIVAVHALRIKLALGHACSHTCQLAVTHGLAAGLAAHSVRVVIDIEDQRQSALSSILPKGTVLIHGRKGKSLPDRSASHGAVSQVRHYHAFLVVAFLEQGRACSDGCGAAYQGVIRINSKGQEERVHGAAQSHVETIFTGKQLSQSSVYQEFDCQLFYISLCFAGCLDGLERLASKEILHDVEKLLVLQLLDTGKTLRQNLAVASVASEGEILLAKQISLAYGSSLLSQGQMGRTGICSLYVGVFRLRLDLVQHILEFAADGHVAEDAEQILFRKVSFIQLLLDGFLIRVDRDILKCNFSLGTHFVRIDKY